jgi:hypothetical protein
LAIFLPFELFLFSYAIFGPLHYLTEISWLHDKSYFTKKKNDYLYLLGITACISFLFLNIVYKFVDLDFGTRPLAAHFTWGAVLLAILFVTVKNNAYRVLGMIVILASMKLPNSPAMTMYLTVFLPTLIHVYIFTGLFMLYGALKSKSRTGMVTIAVFILCPFVLLSLPDISFYSVTPYAKDAYSGNGGPVSFLSVSIETLHLLFGTTVTAATHEEANSIWLNNIFHSEKGIAVARIVAFAYTYHYLNWFSKTKIIQWHKVPKLRFALVIAAWVASIALYAVSFATGMVWLFFLSMTHVLLELPLNAVSVMGIYAALKQRIFRKKEEVPEVKVVKG